MAAVLVLRAPRVGDSRCQLWGPSLVLLGDFPCELASRHRLSAIILDGSFGGPVSRAMGLFRSSNVFARPVKQTSTKAERNGTSVNCSMETILQLGGFPLLSRNAAWSDGHSDCNARPSASIQGLYSITDPNPQSRTHMGTFRH